MAEAGHTMFRPPAEAGSALIRVADGCPHNACAFCGMYRGVPYREYGQAEVEKGIAQAAAARPDARRIFLADGDVLSLPTPVLAGMLRSLRSGFPHLARVNCYASGRALSAKSDRDLELLRDLGLHTLYLGLESGSQAVLRGMAKDATVREMVDGCLRAQATGLSVSVMVLVGIGGREGSAMHAGETAAAVNVMQPRLLSCLRLVPVPGTPLFRRINEGRFSPLTEEEAVRELRTIVAGLELRHTVFRADHSSNILPLAGRLPRDKGRLLAELDELLECGVLDRHGPGRLPAML